ncbi:MAG: peptidase [Epsilonproteobacteria bacterium]|nr:peptidase [Campylobacterota bacterium]
MKIRNKQDILQRITETPKIVSSHPNIDVENRTITFTIISSNNAGERYDWWDGEYFIEELVPSGAITKDLRTFFKDHSYNVDSAIGRIRNIRIENDELKVDVIFGSDDESFKIFKKYEEGILTDVSIGYRAIDIEIIKDEPKHILLTKFEILELSAVWKGFDRGAGLRNFERQHANKIKTKLNLLQKKLNLKGKL